MYDYNRYMGDAIVDTGLHYLHTDQKLDLIIIMEMNSIHLHRDLPSEMMMPKKDPKCLSSFTSLTLV